MKPIFFLMTLVLALGLACSKAKAPSTNATPVVGIPSPAPTQDLSTALDGLTSTTPEVSSSNEVTASGPASQESLEYVMEDLKGSVRIREVGSTESEAAEEEEVVDEGDEIITGASSEASLTLDENTLIHIPQNSDVKVEQLKPKPETGFVSRLELLSGRVLSEVEKLDESHSTFEVESGGVVCGVRGTAFEVQKEGETIHTFTYHGVVDMCKGGQIQAVVADHHSAFSPQNGGFLKPRPLSDRERGGYQDWLRKKTVVQKKQTRRLAVLRTLSHLPPAEKNRVLENLRGVPPRDRMRRMHQMLLHPARLRPNRMERPRKGEGPSNPGLKQRGMPAQRGRHSRIQDRRPQGSSHSKPAGLPKQSPRKAPAQFQKRPGSQPHRMTPPRPYQPQMGRPSKPKPSRPLRPAQGKPQRNNGKKPGKKDRKAGEQ